MNIDSDYTPEEPLRDALRAITGEEPPEWIGDAYVLRDLPEKLWHYVQDWCADHANPEWATGLGIIEAAEMIVDGAVENGNIPPKR